MLYTGDSDPCKYLLNNGLLGSGGFKAHDRSNFWGHQ